MSKTAVSDKRIYLDYASTTPIDKKVFKKMKSFFFINSGNPASLYKSGRIAKRAIDQARVDIAKILNVIPEEIIFTGSGTESDNLALLGVARANKNNGNHIIISAIEHKAVMESAKLLQSEGFEITILPVDGEGLVDIEDCVKYITPKTILVSVMYANNEIGTVEPIKELADAIKKKRGINHFPLLHTDACQAAGFLSLDVKKLGVDLMTLNGSKIYGPKGVGILYKKHNVKIDPLIVGGGQEMGFRAGTENVPYIVGLAEALKNIVTNQETDSKKLVKIRDYFINRLTREISGIVVNGHKTLRLPNNVHLSIPHIEGESIILLLDSFGIEASTGSACSTRDLKPSHVLIAIGQGTDLIHGSIRFSIGKHTKKDDIDYVMSIFPKVVDKLKQMSALTISK